MVDVDVHQTEVGLGAPAHGELLPRELKERMFLRDVRGEASEKGRDQGFGFRHLVPSDFYEL